MERHTVSVTAELLVTVEGLKSVVFDKYLVISQKRCKIGT